MIKQIVFTVQIPRCQLQGKEAALAIASETLSIASTNVRRLSQKTPRYNDALHRCSGDSEFRPHKRVLPR